MEYNIGIGASGGKLKWTTLELSGAVSASDFLETIYNSSKNANPDLNKNSADEDLSVSIISEIDGEFQYRVDLMDREKYSFVTVICKEKEPY